MSNSENDPQNFDQWQNQQKNNSEQEDQETGSKQKPREHVDNRTEAEMYRQANEAAQRICQFTKAIKRKKRPLYLVIDLLFDAHQAAKTTPISITDIWDQRRDPEGMAMATEILYMKTQPRLRIHLETLIDQYDAWLKKRPLPDSARVTDEKMKQLDRSYILAKLDQCAE